MVAVHHYGVDAIEIRWVDARFDGQFTRRGWGTQGGVIGCADVVIFTVKAQREICTWAKFHHPVNWEILRVVFQIIPISRLDGTHVWARNVDVILLIGHAWLIRAPLTVNVGCAVVPTEHALLGRVVQAGPQVTRDVPVVAPRFVQPRVLSFVVHGDQEAVEAASGLRGFSPRRCGEQVVGVVVCRVDFGVQDLNVQRRFRASAWGQCGEGGGEHQEGHEGKRSGASILHAGMWPSLLQNLLVK